MAHRHRAQGGRNSNKGRESFVSAPSEREAKSEKDSFKRGGRHVGKAHGHKAKARADKRARGGGVTHSPFSSAAVGNDMKRRPGDKDGHQPRAAGGAVTRAEGGAVGAFKHGGRAKRHAGMGGSMGGSKRPHPLGNKHEYNFGAHNGSGHEEPLMTHPPVHEKHGGVAHHKSSGGHHHAGHGAHEAHHPGHDGHHSGHHGVHGSHKAKGRKHRAMGGKCDKEED